MKKTILSILLFLGFLNLAQAQVTSVLYLIEYNETSSLYDCKIVIIEGEAMTYPERIQFNCQYTIVTPAGALISVDSLYNPLENNQFYTGTIPCLWEFGPAEYSPPTQPENDFHTVIPNLSPPSAYYNLFPGDTIILFSLSIDVDPCDNSVRLFENGVDPSSIDMPSGGDFSCGCAFGGNGGAQIYAGNLSTEYVNSYITANDSLSICIGDCIDLTPTITCFDDPLKYEWSTGETTEIIEVCPTESTNYYVLVKDTMDNYLDSISVFVDFVPIITNVSSDTVCAGESVILEGCSNGTWNEAPGNPSAVSVSPLEDGFVEVTFDDASNGIFNFVYSISGSFDTVTIVVNPLPDVAIDNNTICLGQSVQVTSTNFGTWISNDPSIALVNPTSGFVTSINEGTVTFTFTDTSTGCSNSTGPLSISLNIEGEVTGPDTICIGGTTTVIPSSGGTWISDNPVIATADNIGNVTGTSSGTANLIFTETSSGCQSLPLEITVEAEPTELIGPSSICIGETTNFIPIENGTWVSSDPAIATINNFGVVTGVGEGIVVFYFTNTSTGCQSEASEQITVSEKADLWIGYTQFCIGNSTQLISNQEGTWASNNTAVATVNALTGLATAVGQGTTGFSFTNSSGCTTNTSLSITVNPPPVIQLIGPSEICLGQTTLLGPNTGGTWQSADNSILTITNLGVATGVGLGTTSVVFRETSTQCDSDPIDITVSSNLPQPVASSNSPICVGGDLELITDAVSNGTFQWYGPNGFTSNDQNPYIPNVTSEAEGQYCVSVQVEDCSSIFGCTTVTLDQQISTPIITSYGSTCEGEDLLLLAQSVAGVTYYWTGPNGFTSSENSVQLSGSNGSDAGTYCVVVELNGCVSEAGCLDVQINPQPSAPNVNNNGPICEGENINLTTNFVAGATYAWIGPNGFSSTNQNPVITNATASYSGTYCVIVTVEGCESEQGCTEVEVKPTPLTPTASNNGPICEGENIILTTDAIAGASFEWVGPNAFISNNQNPIIPNANPLYSGTYCVIVTVEGCPSWESCTDVVINPTPSIPTASNNGPICEGENLNFTTNSLSGATYSWTGPNGFTSSDQNPIIVSADPTDNGSYCVVVTIDGCSSWDGCTVVEILPRPFPTSVGFNVPYCEGGDLKLTANYIESAIYSWTGPNGFYSSDQNPIVQFTTLDHVGQYCLVITVNGCESTPACGDVVIHPLPQISTIENNGPLCKGENLILSTSEIEGATYKWYGPNGYFSSEINPILTDTSLINTGTYRVKVDLNGCKAEADTEVIVNPRDSLPTIQASTSVCIGNDLELSTDELPNGEYEWTGPNGFEAYIHNPVIPSVTSSASGTYTLLASNILSQCPNIEEVTFEIEVINCFDPQTACDEIGPDDIICNFNDFAGVSGSLSNENSPGNQPTGFLCNSTDEAQNISWIGFVALEGDYDIVINTTNCLLSSGDTGGDQIGLYSDCSFTESSEVFCENKYEAQNETRISSNTLTPDQTYFLYIDGFEGSLCDYSIDIDGFYDNTYCTDLSKVTGVAYIDANENGTYELGETLLRNALISLSPGNFSVLTNDEGKYIINTPKGGVTLTAKMNEGHWINDELTIEDLTIFETCVEGINFGFVANLFYQEANISVANSVTRCDWETRFYFTVENTGTIDLEAKFEFEFDDKASYFSTNLIGLQVSGNVASGNLGVMKPFEVREYWIKLKMPSGSTVLPILDFKTTLYNSERMEMDEYKQSELLRCSYDPNDKREFPNREGEENLTLMNEDLEYTIRFQNNGNDTAFQVKIVDPLDPNIDPSSIRVINSSHPVETCIENEILIFLFEDIYLVDSMTNYDASQGYVSFRCSTKEGVPENTIVNNTADIIFDTNIPIVTNSTINTLVSELCSNVTSEIDIKICDGDNFNGYEESGIYTEIFPLEYDCDSIVVINLDVQGVTFTSQDVEICEGEPFDLNGQTYELYDSQEILDTIVNGDGCISTVFIFDVQVNPVLMIEIDTIICEGLDYNGLTESGIYTIDSFDVNTGCDITTTIDLEVLPLSDPACIVGIDDLDEKAVKIFPNPVRNTLFIDSESLIEGVSIYSISFQKVHEIELFKRQNKLEISTEDLNHGLYIIAIKSSGKVVYKKLIVEK